MNSCPHCGAPVGDGAGDCPACGLHLSAPHPAPPAPTLGRWHPGRRVVIGFLLTVAAIALIFVLAMVYFIRHTTIVTTGKNGDRVEAPNATVTTNANAAALAHSLGVEPYPGARAESGAQAELASSIIVTFSYRTPDPPRKVIAFYHVRYPDATIKAEGKGMVLVLVSLRDTLTIKAVPQSGSTEISVSDIRR